MRGTDIILQASRMYSLDDHCLKWVEEVRTVATREGWSRMNLDNAWRMMDQIHKIFGPRDVDWIWLDHKELWFKDAKKSMLFKLSIQET